MFVYLISYFYKDKRGNTGVGRAIIETNNVINTREMIEEVEKSIKVQYNVANAVMMNFQLLEVKRCI